ncbi:MAG: undecaprenyl-diphosphatase UppP [bacterium]|nr:undecaprenyl-diphosphatase UppP [Candidatus Sumerlaeota bacterium]
MINIWQAATLGSVQGLTEFLPVSSSAHLVLVPWLFKWPAMENEMAFDVALHLGTLFAVGIYFFWEWLHICASYIGDLRQRRWLGGPKGGLLPKIIAATIPAAVVGKLFEGPIEKYFYQDEQHLWILAVTLSVFGSLLLLSERLGSKKRQMSDLSYRGALIIGAAQALALVPGASRSGVTIFAALLIGMNREAAARFSFLLSTPIIAGAVLLKLKALFHSDQRVILAVGVITSAIVGIIAIKFLLRYVQTRGYAIFVYYRWIIAVIVLAVYASRHWMR